MDQGFLFHLKFSCIVIFSLCILSKFINIKKHQEFIYTEYTVRKIPGPNSSQEPDRPALHGYRRDCSPGEFGPYLFWTEIRTYLDGAFYNGIIRLKKPIT